MVQHQNKNLLETHSDILITLEQ